MLYALGYLTLVLVAIDLAVYHIYGPEPTISNQVLVLCQQYPIVALAIGVILGHAMWPQRP